ncbi:MAG: hypothetical protein ACRD00_06300 [Thermoanaerobaculia bacterium]
MRSKKLAACVLAALAVCAGAGCRQNRTADAPAAALPPSAARPPAAPGGDVYGLRPAEKTAVEAFLKAHADLRLSADSDARTADASLTKLYGVYHPFFVRGDVNDDGLLDFVTAFARRDSPAGTPWFSVVVFTGRAGGAFDAGTFLERDVSLTDGDISVDRDSIVITPDTSDDPNRRYRWDAVRRQFAFVRDDDEPPDAQPAART